MTTEESENICARHYEKWKRYLATGRCKNVDNVFAELNNVHFHIYRVAQKLDCQSCLKDLLHNVFNWYEEELKKKVNIEKMRYYELLNHARKMGKSVPHNATKENILNIIHGKERE